MCIGLRICLLTSSLQIESCSTDFMRSLARQNRRALPGLLLQQGFHGFSRSIYKLMEYTSVTAFMMSHGIYSVLAWEAMPLSPFLPCLECL